MNTTRTITTRFILLIAFTLTLVIPAASDARIIHMAVNGSNADGDGSAANPFDGLQRCIAEASPGDTIYVHEGKYTNEPRTGGYQVIGREDAWIVIMGAPNEDKPVFAARPTMVFYDGGDDTGDSQYFVLKDLIWRKDIITEGAHCINIFDGEVEATPAHHIIIEGCEFYNQVTNSEMIKMAGVDDFIIRNTLINASNAHSLGIGAMGCHSGEVYNCRIDSCMMGGIQFKGGSSEVVIRNNVVNMTNLCGVNIGGDAWWEYVRPPVAIMEEPTYEARGIHVYSNIFIDCVVAISFNTCRDSKAYNNLIIRTDLTRNDSGPYGNYGLVWIRHRSNWCPNPSHHCTLANNIFYFHRREPDWENVVWRTVAGDEGDSSFTFEFYNNLWYCFEDPSSSWASWDDAGRVSPPVESGNIFGENPNLYADPETGLLIPGNNTLLAGRGVPMTPPEGYVFADFFGDEYSYPPPIGPVNITSELPTPPAPPDSVMTYPGDLGRIRKR